MSGSLQPWAAALGLSLALAGCGNVADRGDNVVSGAARAGLNTMRAASVGHLRAAEARDYLAAHPEALILDVREVSEFDGELGHIDGARLIPLGELAARMGEIEAWKDKPVVVVCAVGARSRDAGMTLAAAGFQQVMTLEGGMVAWTQGGP